MGFTEVPTRGGGYELQESDWDDYIKTNFNTGVWARLGEVTLASPAASINFTSIPNTFAHLMLVAYLRGTFASSLVNCRVRFNGDTGNNYDYQVITSTLTTPAANESFAQSSAFVGNAPASSAPLYSFGVVRLIIPHYSQATNNKIGVGNLGNKNSLSAGGMENRISAYAWRSNAAINQVAVFPASGNWDVGSHVTLYAKG